MHLAMILAAMLAVTGTSRERELGGRWSWEERHRQLVSKIAENPEATYDIVFIGDGLTELMANVRQGNDAVFAEYFGKYRTFNLGIQGDRLENLVWRLENGALDGYRAKVFRIMAGSNNLPQKWPPAMLAEGVGRLVELIRAKHPEAKIEIVAILPRADRRMPKGGMDRLQAANTLIAHLADGDSVTVVDPGSAFLEADGSLKRQYYRDGLHLSPDGYRALFAAEQSAIGKLLE
ncbi:MAG: hypothetical protein J6P80_01930 [Kiritimatiellae bacterium]|nr:hypothetical protein [Kiritimatiellia bacterium]